MNKIKSPLGILIAVCVLSAAAAAIFYSSVKVKDEEGNSLSLIEKLFKENNISVNADGLGGINPANNLPQIIEEDHLWGDIKNPVKIIIYSDFECPFCAKLSKDIEKVKSEYGGKVVIAFRHRILASHPAAMPAALASECAAEQGKFWEMHDKLFEDAGESNLTVEEFKKDGRELGLKMEKFTECLTTEKYKTKITNQMNLGKQAGADGTPTFFVNGEVYPGAYPYEDFVGSDGGANKGLKSIIERHLAR